MTESELINGCKKNDAHCQRLLFEQYSARLMAVCLRYACDRPEAEDMLQESFIRIYSYITQYKAQGSFEGWIKKIVIHCAIRYAKKRRSKLMEPVENANQQIPGQDFIIPNLTETELLKLISTLPDGYRLVFNLYVIEGYSHDEIAEMLNIETATSRSQLLKARRVLQEQILLMQKIPAAS